VKGIYHRNPVLTGGRQKKNETRWGEFVDSIDCKDTPALITGRTRCRSAAAGKEWSNAGGTATCNLLARRKRHGRASSTSGSLPPHADHHRQAHPRGLAPLPKGPRPPCEHDVRWRRPRSSSVEQLQRTNY
jgi:hypothetical protein